MPQQGSLKVAFGAEVPAPAGYLSRFPSRGRPCKRPQRPSATNFQKGEHPRFCKVITDLC